MNDEINRLFREKRHWEYRIKELGGPDYLVGKLINKTFVRLKVGFKKNQTRQRCALLLSPKTH